MENTRNIDACRMVKQNITEGNYKKEGGGGRERKKERESNKVKTVS